MTIIEWTHPAVADLHSIQDFIARDNPTAASRVIEDIQENIEKLVDFLSLGPRGMIAGTRELAIIPLPYVVAYRFKHDVIQILAILHTARDREQTLAKRL